MTTHEMRHVSYVNYDLVKFREKITQNNDGELEKFFCNVATKFKRKYSFYFCS